MKKTKGGKKKNPFYQEKKQHENIARKRISDISRPKFPQGYQPNEKKRIERKRSRKKIFQGKKAEKYLGFAQRKILVYKLSRILPTLNGQKTRRRKGDTGKERWGAARTVNPSPFAGSRGSCRNLYERRARKTRGTNRTEKKRCQPY